MTVGARALLDLLHHSFSWADLVRVTHYTQCGGMWGGPLAFLALAGPLVLLAGQSAAERRGALDLIALSLPIPMMLAKAGCLCQGCCAGASCPWPWAVRFPSGGGAPAGVPLHPTQVYEILILAGVLAALMALNRPIQQGWLLTWFLVLYGPGRALTEIWRGDRAERVPLGPFTTSQLLLLAAAFLAAACLAQRRPRIQSVEAAEP